MKTFAHILYIINVIMAMVQIYNQDIPAATLSVVIAILIRQSQ